MSTEELASDNENSETRQKKHKIEHATSVMKILQAAAIIAGIFGTYFEYHKWRMDQALQLKEEYAKQKEQEKLQLDQTARQFQRFFYEKQFEYYSEATEVTAIMATSNKKSLDYSKARAKFYILYWGRLTIVEDRNVEKRMMEIDKILRENDPDPYNFESKLTNASYNLAHDARAYILNVWVDSSDRNNYNK